MVGAVGFMCASMALPPAKRSCATPPAATTSTAAEADRAEPSGLELASVVKGMHHRLRCRAHRVSEEQLSRLWQEHVQNESSLREYAAAMYALATRFWDEGKDGRVAWCYAYMQAYFREGGAEQAHAKDLRRRAYQLGWPLDQAIVSEPLRNPAHRLTMLDVGSCYNPFAEQARDWDVLPLDIAPATSAVMRCDFLHVAIGDHLVVSEGSISQLPASGFDACVFSLLLSYLPTAELRFRCCANARRVLRANGLLLVITPDSNHQGKGSQRMKKWQLAIEHLGFRRCKYTKLPHLHCMAFRAVSSEFAVIPDT